MTTRRSRHLEFVLPRPPNSLGLAPSDFNLFGSSKDSLCGRRFADDDELKQRDLRVPTLQLTVLGDRHTASNARVRSYIDNAGKIVEK
jgi:hypothetical protein